MKRKTVFSAIIVIAILFYSCSCFASNEIVGGVTGNVLNKTENVVGDVGNAVGGATESVVNGVTNVAQDIGSGVKEGAENIGNSMSNMTGNSMLTTATNEHNASATNAASGNTFLGLNTTTWWWVIIGAICLLLVFLVWHKMENHVDSDE